MFGDIYHGKRVLMTGHTGFKGSWLTSWLEHLGAHVTGYALAPITEPNHFNQLSMNGKSVIGDIRDVESLEATYVECQPEIVFHMAAQPSVLASYEDPIETFTTNLTGTANLLEIIRKYDFTKGVVVITSDKCYENREWLYGYRETDTLGGHDPYSASKACTEIIAASFRRSFLQQAGILLATARAGNVIGGGDWTADRLLPDAMVAANRGEAFNIRNPQASRPWQHVLEPLSGYLCLGKHLLEGRAEAAEAWNFGPSLESNLTTGELVALASQFWPRIESHIAKATEKPHEAGLLMVDSTKARRFLKWNPVWGLDTSVKKTIQWYRAFYESQTVLTAQQIIDYETRAIDLETNGANK